MYIRNRETIQIDPSGMELRPEGLKPFNVVANDIDLRLPLYRQYTIAHHWHAEMELFLLTEGCVCIEAGNQAIHLSAGEGCFINSGVIHAFSSDNLRPYVFQSIVFDAAIVGGAPASAFDLRLVKPILETGPGFLAFTKGREASAFLRLFNDIFLACRDEPDGFEIEIRYGLSRMLRMIIALAGSKDGPPPSKRREDRVKEMLQWIDSHMSEKLTVEEIAASSNICRRECFRLFRQYLRTTPMGCVNQRRIMAAARRISTTDDPIAVIALDCGFATPNYFSKRFQEQMGLPPREWRNMIKSGQIE